MSENPAARIDGLPSPGGSKITRYQTGEELAGHWYAQGLANTPGAGKLHHHLGLLSQEKDGKQLRSIYHFVKRSVSLGSVVTRHSLT